MQFLRFKKRIRDLSSVFSLVNLPVRAFSVSIPPVSNFSDATPSTSALQRFLLNKNDISKLDKKVTSFSNDIAYLTDLQDQEMINIPKNSFKDMQKDMKILKKAEFFAKEVFDEVKNWIHSPQEYSIVDSFGYFLKTFPEEQKQDVIETIFFLFSRRAGFDIQRTRSSSEGINLNELNMLVNLYLEYNFHEKRSYSKTLDKKERSIDEIYKENYYLHTILDLYDYSKQYQELIDFYEKLNEKYEINLDLEICRRLIFSYGHVEDYKKIISIYKKASFICDNVEISDFTHNEGYQFHLQIENLLYSTAVYNISKGNNNAFKYNAIEIVQKMMAKGFKPTPTICKVVLNVCAKIGYVSLAYDITKLLPKEKKHIRTYFDIVWAIYSDWRVFYNSHFQKNFCRRKDASKILDFVENEDSGDIDSFISMNTDKEDNIIVDEEYQKTMKKRVSSVLDTHVKREKFYDICSRLKIDLDSTEKANKVDEINEYVKKTIEDVKVYSKDVDLFNTFLLFIGEIYMNLNNFDYFEEFVKNNSILELSSMNIRSLLISIYYYAHKGDTNKVEELINNIRSPINRSDFDYDAFCIVLLTLTSMKNEVGFDGFMKLFNLVLKNSRFTLRLSYRRDIEKFYLDSGLHHPIGNIISEWN